MEIRRTHYSFIIYEQYFIYSTRITFLEIFHRSLVATHEVELRAVYVKWILGLEGGRMKADGSTSETLFSIPDQRTSHKRLTGVAHPVDPEQLVVL